MRAGRSKNEIGKLIKGYNWKIAGIIDNSDSVYNPGDSVKLSFASTPDTVTAVIESLEPTDDPSEWVLILRCDEMTYDLVQKRVERVEMTLNDFEGIRVPREALRFNKNNEKGCYVLWGQRVLFKKVDTILKTTIIYCHASPPMRAMSAFTTTLSLRVLIQRPIWPIRTKL